MKTLGQRHAFLNLMQCAAVCCLLLAAGSLAGCGGGANSSEAKAYTTIPELPGRDTSAAEAACEEALASWHEGDVAAAETKLKEALAADVMYGPAHNNLGRIYLDQGKLYHAAWEFQYAVKLMPNQAEPRNNLGLALEAAGKYDDAVKELEAARERQPDNAEILGNLARVKSRRGDSDDAYRDLLDELIMKDTRPEWLHWAKLQRVSLNAN